MVGGSPIKIWRKFRSRYRLLGNECIKCNRKHYPPVLVCKGCGSDELKEYMYPPIAKLITWSKVNASPKGFESYTPYIVAIVELEGGERMSTQLVDVEESELKYEMKLKPCFRKVFVDGDKGVIHYAVKFKPVSG